MDVKVNIKNMNGEINAIASKSDAHRLLIAAALSDRPCRIIKNSTSDDIKATVSCLNELGAVITEDGFNLAVEPINKLPDGEITLDCNESGSTIRFLIPVAAALGVNAVFTGHGRLPERPQAPILRALSQHGVTVSGEKEFPIKTSGQLQSGVFEISGNISSQFVTGLLFALPLLDGNSVINLIPPVQSKPYINLTLKTLRQFGVKVRVKGNSYYIDGNQHYSAPREIKVDGDWSNGAFFIAAGAISDVTIKGLNVLSLQGDKKIIDIVRKMGADVVIHKDSIHVSKNRLNGIIINASDIPDLVPVIAALALFADGTTKITHAERLRIKESDRLATVTEMIRNAGGDVTELADGLIINGGKMLKERFKVSSYNDHRLVMASTLLSFSSDVTITNAEAVNKSYPAFFEDITKIGGTCDVIDNR